MNEAISCPRLAAKGKAGKAVALASRPGKVPTGSSAGRTQERPLTLPGRSRRERVRYYKNGAWWRGTGKGDLCVTLSLPPAAPDRFVQPGAHVVRQREELAVAVEFNGLARGVEDHAAVLALVDVRLERTFQILVEVPIQVVRNLRDHFLTGKQVQPRLKILLRSSRRRRRARKSLALTAPTERPSKAAVSSVDRPSTSRR